MNRKDNLSAPDYGDSDSMPVPGAVNEFFADTDLHILLAAGCIIAGALFVFIGIGRFYMHFMEVGNGAAGLLAMLTCVLAYAAVRFAVRTRKHDLDCMAECEADAGNRPAAEERRL